MFFRESNIRPPLFGVITGNGLYVDLAFVPDISRRASEFQDRELVGFPTVHRSDVI